MQLPPLQVTRAVIQRYARLLHRYENDLGNRPLVLPNGDFFPDEFLGDEESVRLLVFRMLEHAGLADVPVTARVIGPDSPPVQEKCSSGSCGVPVTSKRGLERLIDNGDSWIVQVPSQELKHSVALTTNLARSLAFIFMVETQKEGELLEPPVDVTADLIAVALGFGPLMLQGSYIYAKSCGGPQVARVTKIGLGELAVAVALFSALGKHPIPRALKHLDVTQKEALKDASYLLSANKSLVEKIRKDPEGSSRLDFALEEPGTFVSQFLGRWGKKQDDTGTGLDRLGSSMNLDEVEELFMDMPPSSQAGRTSRPPPPTNPERDELKDLVTEALQQARL